MIPWESCVLWLGYPIQNGVWPDVSKHDNDGIVTGAFWEGDSLEFDGIDDYVNCGHDSLLDTTTIISVEALVKPTGAPKVYSTLVDKDVQASSSGYSFLVHNDRLLYFYIGAGNWKESHTVTTLQDGSWYHVVGVYNGTNIKVYVNGVLEGTPTAQTPPLSTGVQDCYVGRSVVSNREFDGKIALLRMFNSVLSAEQIKEAYEQSYKLV